MTLLDGTVVNVALRTIGRELDASLAELQWISNGYLLSLAALILLGGSLGDRYGRRRIFVVGTVWFAAASALCGLAPNPEVLIAARVLQGIGGGLLTPGSLAMIQGAFVPDDRSPAIGAWTGFGGIAAAVGPFVGGALIEVASWRWIFLINVPLAALTIWIAQRHVPESRSSAPPRHFDVAGAVLAMVALAGVTYGLIGWGERAAVWAGLLGLGAGVAFVLVEARLREPMLPPAIFRSRVFSSANAMTLVVYAALGAILFFLVLQLQTVAGWTPLAAGVATLPITVVMLLLAARGGRLAVRIGPRIPLTTGPLLMAGGTLLLRAADAETSYVLDVLPGLTVFALGLALMVAPLTATVLAAAPDDLTGLASGVNNAIARSGSLLAVAALPPLVGLSGQDYDVAPSLDAAYDTALLVSAGLLVVGALLAWVLLVPERGVRRKP
ncbi:MFS transporter [Nocardioides coralli]|nr:MFS transporter [Nocardioides coralli]